MLLLTLLALTKILDFVFQVMFSPPKNIFFKHGHPIHGAYIYLVIQAMELRGRAIQLATCSLCSSLP